MQVNNVSMNSNKPAFTAGVSSNLYKKIAAENPVKADIFEKIDDISKSNYKEFVLSDVVYDAKNKITGFVLSAVDIVKFIPGLENLESKIVKASGKNITEAFKNIDLKVLGQANESLALDTSKVYKETMPMREKLLAKRDTVQSELKRKYDTADGFWIEFNKTH